MELNSCVCCVWTDAQTTQHGKASFKIVKMKKNEQMVGHNTPSYKQAVQSASQQGTAPSSSSSTKFRQIYQ